MRTFRIEVGPMVRNQRALWIVGDVSELKVGDTLVTDDGEPITIDAIGISSGRPLDSLPVLTNATINAGLKTAYMK